MRRPPPDSQARSSPPPAGPGPLARLRALLEARGLRPTRGRGQNFLADENLAKAIPRDAGIRPGDAVLEIGAGTGILTARLREAGAVVAAAEIEPALAGYLRERFGADPRVAVVEGDAFEGEGWSRALRDALRGLAGGRPVRLVSNLSYAIATKAVLAFLEDPEFAADPSVVMLQRELADRLRAAPGTPEYGAPSVRVQALAEVRILRRVPPDVFWPRPSISSCLALLRPRPGRLARLRHPAFPGFRDIVRAAFLRRRKTLESGLRGAAAPVPPIPGEIRRCRPGEVPPEAYWAWATGGTPP